MRIAGPLVASLGSGDLPFSSRTNALDTQVDGIGTMEKLRAAVDSSLSQRQHYDELRKRQGTTMPYNFGLHTKIVRQLVSAEDDLARAVFEMRVEKERERVEEVAELEIARISQIERAKTPHDLQSICCVCDEDLSNNLLLAKKYGGMIFPSIPLR